jgi:aspartyl protease family protein
MIDPEPPSPWGKRPDHRPRRHPNDINRKSRFPSFVVGVIAFLFILVIAAWVMPGDGIGMSGLFYDGLLLAFVGAGLWAHVSSSPGVALRHLATWVIIFGILALGYSIWTGGGRIGGELDVAAGINEGSSISYRADMSGHYFVRAEVNGVDVVFMVDTGATDVALTQADARKIGLPVDRLSYSMPYKTANGLAYGARVRLSTIELGPILQKNITGSVLPEGLDYSLLGMSFLNKLSGYKVAGGVLTLYP